MTTQLTGDDQGTSKGGNTHLSSTQRRRAERTLSVHQDAIGERMRMLATCPEITATEKPNRSRGSTVTFCTLSGWFRNALRTNAFRIRTRYRRNGSFSFTKGTWTNPRMQQANLAAISRQSPVDRSISSNHRAP